ncbi:hypothetical protein [uncultured Psychroserpens sp.]|uniref:hypothetical protein n=1 Tax=uncultured Psychroserpens sp. TaxID=255436 RepID=UPI0026034363|nr:hypothetical protein [uncultured Psychroserpens sp.]
MTFNFQTEASIKFSETKLLCNYRNETANTAIENLSGINYVEYSNSKIRGAHLFTAPFLIGGVLVLLSFSSLITFIGYILLIIAGIFFVTSFAGSMLGTNWNDKIVQDYFAEKYYKVEIKGENNWTFTFPVFPEEEAKLKKLKSYIEELILDD